MSFNNRTITDNLQGIASLEYIYSQDATQDYSGLTLKSNKSWNEIPIVRKSVNPETKQKETAGGVLYETIVKFRIAKDDKAFSEELHRMALRYLIIKETDHNGTMRLIGSVKVPAKLEFDISKAGFNGYECQIKHADTSPPSYI